jgi:hypothetical protein
MLFLSYQNYHNGAVSKQLTGVGMGKSVHVRGDSESLHVLQRGRTTECQAFFQSSELGSPTPSPARECWVQGGRHTRLRRREDSIPTKGQTLWCSMYTIIPLRGAQHLLHAKV